MRSWRGKEAILEILTEFGVRFVFGNPGTTEIPFLDMFARRKDLQYILCLHEAVAVGMAHGFAAASERPAFVNLHATPGVANAMGNLYNAFRAGVPMVVTAGQLDRRIQIFEPPLWSDLTSLVRPFVKWSWEPRTAEELPLVLARALKVAVDVPQGPVFISLPMNLLDETFTAELQIPSRSRGPTHPDPAAVDQAAQVLAQAERPVIIAGDGVAKSHAVPAMIRLSEAIAAEVYAERMPHRISFPTGHPLYQGPIGFHASEIQSNLAGADVILLVGTNRIIPVVHHGGPLIPFGSRVIQVDEDAWEAGKNTPGAILITADVNASLEMLAEKVVEKVAPRRDLINRWRSALEQRANARHSLVEQEVAETWNREPISLPRLIREMRRALPENGIVVDESSTSSLALHRYFEFPHEDTYFGIKGGSLGYGLPAALGVKLARPERPVVAFIGDGAALYVPQALWTAAHYNIAITVIVCNNRSYRILKEGFRSYGGAVAKTNAFVGCDLVDPTVDFVKLAGAFGVKALHVRNPEDLRPSLEEAIYANYPILLDVWIEQDGR